MAEEALVESQITESIKLVEELDRQDAGPTNALWYFFSDADEWRLLIAGPAFDEFLPKQELEAYRLLAKAMRATTLQALSIADVKLIRTDDPLLDALRPAIATRSDGVMRAHFRDNTFNGIFVKEMIVLRAA